MNANPDAPREHQFACQAMMITLKDMSLAQLKMEAMDVEIGLLEEALGSELLRHPFNPQISQSPNIGILCYRQMIRALRNRTTSRALRLPFLHLANTARRVIVHHRRAPVPC